MMAAVFAVPTLRSAGAQTGVIAYPNAGQSPQQQQRDQFECHQWSIQQTGFDPSAPPQATPYYTSPPPTSASGPLGIGEGPVLRDAGKGAALGAIGGAIAGDAGKGAAIGAATTTLFGAIRRSNRQYEQEQWQRQQQAQMQQQQQQVAQQHQVQMQNYNRAYGACMAARNYTVR